VRLRQVLKNLLLNAVKFTGQGEIRLEIRKVWESAARDALELYFSVSDTGIGIPPGKQEEIFVAFVQAESSYSRRFGGAGLGLSISSRLVKLMGGDIRVQSPASQSLSPGGGPGSTFYFTLPFKVAVPPPVKRDTEPVCDMEDIGAAAGMEKLNILVAEDNKINQRLIAMRLQQLGHKPTLVENGEEVLKKMKTRSGEFDLIFMDLQMPLMDGIEAAGAIRKMEQKRPGRHIPIIALTAHNTGEDRRKVMEAGMDDHVAKPVSASKLSEAIHKIIPVIQKNRS
jgi:CheY-like chemotaxis protein